MNSSRCLVTGATGFVGSHVAETLINGNSSVVTVARPTSDTGFLEELGVEIVRGDLSDPGSVQKAAQGVDVIIHCAAKVGDWGPVEDYRQVNVGGVRNLLDAAREHSVQRFVHLSSLGVYEARHHYGTDETVAVPENHMDGYTQTKVESEALALEFHRKHQVPVVVLRPGFIYGPRDRTVLPKLIDSLRNKQVRYLGSGDQAMNTIFVGNLVDAIMLAIKKHDAVGEVFNLTDDEAVSKRRFIEAIADLSNLERPTRKVPLWLARLLAKIIEGRARKRGASEAPMLTQARLKFLGLNLGFSVEKAKRVLGYKPRVRFEEGIEEAITWWKSEADESSKFNCREDSTPEPCAVEAGAEV